MAKAKTSSTKSKTKHPATSTKAAKAESEPTITRVSVSSSATTGAGQKMGQSFKGELVLGALVGELVGTFILTVCLLNSGGNVIIAGLTVMIMTMALSRISGGHINPAITIGMWATKQISAIKGAGYIVAQILGAMLALVVVTQFVHATPTDATTGQAATVFSIADVNGQWRPFFAEALGGLVFGIGAAAAVIGRKNSHESGFIVGGALLLGLIVASLGSASVINPAVAIGVSAYHANNFWTIATYAIAPILGVTAGAWLYKLVQWDVTGKKSIEE